MTDNNSYRVSDGIRNGTATRLDANNVIHRFLVVILGPVISQVYQQFAGATWNAPGGVVPQDPGVPYNGITQGTGLDPIAGSVWLVVWDDATYSVVSTLSGLAYVS